MTTTRNPSANSSARRSATPGAACAPLDPGRSVTHPEATTVSAPGPGATESTVHNGASVCSRSRSQSRWSWGNVNPSAPQVTASDPASSRSSSRRSDTRSLRRRGSTTTTRASSSSNSTSSRSSRSSQGSHDSIPSNSSPSARRSQCSRPHGCSATRAPARVRIAASGTISRQGYTSTSARTTVVRWSATPNSQSRSISSPQKSILNGTSDVDGHRSRIEPRTASSPRCSTWYSRR